jgi:uncharacterized protein
MVMASLTLIRGADLVAQPWKNGGGVTREIAAYPEGASIDAFAWRVSVADVAQAGPFSRFDGIDRTLVLLDGAGMILDEAASGGAREHRLTRALDIARFAGEARIDAHLVDGPTRDFNLMVRRDAARGTLELWRADETHVVDAHAVLLYAALGSMRIVIDDGEPLTLQQGDTLRIDDATRAPIATHGDGTLIAIALTITDPEGHTR